LDIKNASLHGDL